MTIVKVQRPLSSADAPWLVYAEGPRDAQVLYPDADFRKAFGPGLKRYYAAEFVSGRWSLRHQVENQYW
jgi:hypothetical protein